MPTEIPETAYFVLLSVAMFIATVAVIYAIRAAGQGSGSDDRWKDKFTEANQIFSD